MFNSDTVRNAKLDAEETAIGTAPILRLYSGTIPADESASLGAAVLLAQGTLPSDWMAAASGGTKAKTGTWTLTGQSGAGAGTAATFGRIYASDGTTCHKQFTVGAATTYNTSANTAANSNVLTFTDTTNVAVGQSASGTGIPAGATVLAKTGTTVTLSHASVAGVGSGVTVTFGYEMNLDTNSIANGQSINVSTFSLTAAH